MNKLTPNDRPSDKIGYSRGTAIGLKLMYEDGVPEENLLDFIKYLFPDLDDGQELEKWLKCIIEKPYYDEAYPNSVKPNKINYKEFYDLLIKEYKDFIYEGEMDA